MHWVIPTVMVGSAATAFGYFLSSYRWHRHDFVLEDGEDYIKCGCGVHIPFSRV
jgi:hypothetical protein